MASSHTAAAQTDSTLAQRLHDRIPAGCLSYSKGDDQFPQNAPACIDRAEGCYAYDTDGRRFLDWAMGLRTVMLGHGYPPVLDAVRAQLAKGTNFTRPSMLEVELAERFCALIPSAEMAKFAKNGSDVTSAAIRLARAYTGRDYIVCCGDGSFHSHDDWFIGSTICASGVPACVRELTLRTAYNDLEGLERLLRTYQGKIAALIMEPMTMTLPKSGFLESVRELTQRDGVVLIFDEMITGFRWHLRGAQTLFNVTPDLATFGKALGNGFALGALVGRREIMERGGVRRKQEKMYLLSSTHGGEAHALAAALTTIAEMERHDVIRHIWHVGEQLQTGFNALCAERGMAAVVSMIGAPCSPAIVCRDGDGNLSLPLRTLFLQEMVKGGVLIPYLTPSFAHGAREVCLTLEAARQALTVYQEALEHGLEGRLEGPVVQPVFRAWTHD